MDIVVLACCPIYAVLGHPYETHMEAGGVSTLRLLGTGTGEALAMQTGGDILETQTGGDTLERVVDGESWAKAIVFVYDHGCILVARMNHNCLYSSISWLSRFLMCSTYGCPCFERA